MDKQKFKEELKKTLKSFKDATKKTLQDMNDPINKLDANLKKSLGDDYDKVF